MREHEAKAEGKARKVRILGRTGKNLIEREAKNGEDRVEIRKIRGKRWEWRKWGEIGRESVGEVR